MSVELMEAANAAAGQVATESAAEVKKSPTPVADRYYEKLQRNAAGIGEIYGRRLVWSVSARARLACICGYLEGVKRYDPETAEKMAKELDDRLRFLAGYGGDYEVPNPEQYTDGKGLLVAEHEVMLSDDCWGLGGFGVCWYRCVPWSAVIQRAEERMPCPIGTKDLEEGLRDQLWREALDESKKALKIWESDDWEMKMTETRYRKPVYEGQESWARAETFEYGFSFNGGLILHWNGDPKTASWGIHT